MKKPFILAIKWTLRLIVLSPFIMGLPIAWQVSLAKDKIPLSVFQTIVIIPGCALLFVLGAVCILSVAWVLGEMFKAIWRGVVWIFT